MIRVSSHVQCFLRKAGQGWKPSLNQASINCMEQVLKLCLEESEKQLFAATPQNVLGFWPPTHLKALGICGEELFLGFPEI